MTLDRLLNDAAHRLATWRRAQERGWPLAAQDAHRDGHGGCLIVRKVFFRGVVMTHLQTIFFCSLSYLGSGQIDFEISVRLHTCFGQQAAQGVDFIFQVRPQCCWRGLFNAYGRDTHAI